MKFWDSSAVVPLLLEEPATAICDQALRDDRSIAVWWSTSLECVSAVMRREREGLPAAAVNEALGALDALAGAWLTVNPSPVVASTARRLLRVHTLRAADALQLAAALTLAAGQPESLPLVCFDQRLRNAAAKEGFPLLPG